MASQRHKLLEYGSTAAGEVHAQGVTAISITQQLVTDPSNLNVLVPAGGEGVGKNPPPLQIPEGPTGGPLQGSSMSGAIPESIQAPPPDVTPGPDPVPGAEPTLASLNPNTAEIGAADLVMQAIGTNFTDTSLIYFNAGAEITTFVSATELTTTIKPSLASSAVEVPITVRQGTYETAALPFTFTDTTVQATNSDERSFPIGPIIISRIDDHADGLALTIADGDVQVEDTVLIEATGNTSVNGSYAVLSVEGDVVVVDNNFELLTPIEAKGRLTVTG